MYIIPFYPQVNGEILKGDTRPILSMFTEDRTRKNGHKLKEEDIWVCIKGILLLLNSKARKGAYRIYT